MLLGTLILALPQMVRGLLLKRFLDEITQRLLVLQALSDDLLGVLVGAVINVVVVLLLVVEVLLIGLEIRIVRLGVVVVRATALAV